MKKIHVLIATILFSGSFFLSSCSDDSTGGGTTPTDNTNSDCKIMTATESDGSVSTYTYDGDNLVKYKYEEDGDVYNTIFVYEGGKLTKIEEDESENYIITYDGSNVSKVEERDYDDNELYGYMNYTYNGSTLTKIEVYEHYEAPETDTLIETYTITMNGNNVAKVDIMELDEDTRKLSSSGSIQINSLDDKNNPYYMFPTLFGADYDDVSVLNKNNMTSLSLVTPFGSLPFTVKYEYNEKGFPVKIISSALGETDTTSVVYECK